MAPPEKYDCSVPVLERKEQDASTPEEVGRLFHGPLVEPQQFESGSQSERLPKPFPAHFAKKPQKLREIGLTGLLHPILLANGRGTEQPTVATVALRVGLSPEPPEVFLNDPGNIWQEAHHCQLIRILAEHRAVPFALERLFRLLEEMLLRLRAKSGCIEFSFPATVSGDSPPRGNMDFSKHATEYEVDVRIDKAPDSYPELLLGVTIPITHLLDRANGQDHRDRVPPSPYGNRLRVLTRLHAEMEAEEIVRIIGEEATYDVLGMFKQRDQRWIVRRAQPRFADDLVRDVAMRLAAEPRIAEWTVRIEEAMCEKTDGARTNEAERDVLPSAPRNDLHRDWRQWAEKTAKPLSLERIRSPWQIYAEISGKNQLTTGKEQRRRSKYPLGPE